MKYKIFVIRYTGDPVTPQQIGTIDIFKDKEDGLIEEIIGAMNTTNIRDCEFSYEEDK